jgi:hypothetical protein
MLKDRARVHPFGGNGGSWRKAVVGRFVYLRFCIGLIMCP